MYCFVVLLLFFNLLVNFFSFLIRNDIEHAEKKIEERRKLQNKRNSERAKGFSE